MSARAKKSARSTSPPLLAEVAHGQLHQLDDVARPRGQPQIALEVLAGAAQHVHVHVTDGAEAAALDQHVLLVEDLRRLQHRAARIEHRRAGEPQLDQLHAHQPVVDLAEGDPGELDHVDGDPLGGQAVQQRLDEQLGIFIVIEGAVEEIHPHDPQRLLLERVLAVEHADMDDDLAVAIVGPRLEADPHPAVALVGPAVVARRHRVGEGKEGGGLAATHREAVQVQPVLVLQHRLEARPTDVALRLAVDGVAHRHVVGRHALGHGAGGAADAEEPAHDLLPGPDLGEGAVAPLVEVDSQRLGVDVDHPLTPVDHGHRLTKSRSVS
jgi:hypothetical protein